MFCSSCGKGNAADARFCNACGASVLQTKDSIEAHSALANSVAPRRLRDNGIVLLIVVGLTSIVWLLTMNPSSPQVTAASETRNVKEEIDLMKIALKQRAAVEKVIGKPLKYVTRRSEAEIGDEADYPWGMIGYNRGRAVLVIYKFAYRPANYSEAFATLGLPSPSEPYIRDGDGTMIWSDPIAGVSNTFKGRYRCCYGVAFKDVFITGTFSEMHVYFIDLDNIPNWSADDRATWKSFTNSALPRER